MALTVDLNVWSHGTSSPNLGNFVNNEQSYCLTPIGILRFPHLLLRETE